MLVLDRACRDVVSPLVRVAELRKHGVTLHLLLESERQPIPEVPAVYLVQPSEAAHVSAVTMSAAGARAARASRASAAAAAAVAPGCDSSSRSLVR